MSEERTASSPWPTAVALVALCATVVVICGLGSWVVVSIWGS